MSNPNVKDPAPKGTWRKNAFINWDPSVGQGIGRKPIGTFAIGDTEKKSGLWKKTKL